MKTTLSVYIDNNWEMLDIYSELPITIVIQDTDLSNLEERKSSYSKTFTIPATKQNNKVLKHFYEINGTDFNPYNQLPCVVSEGGTITFEGNLRMNAVIKNNTYNEYEVFILSDVADFSGILGDINLRDIDFDDLSHIHSMENIELSWEATSGDTDGLFGGKILYPFVNYGIEYVDESSTTPAWDFCSGASPCITSSSSPLPYYQFKPSIRVKEVVDRIFDRVGYNYDSEFLNSPYFRSWYMDLSTNGELGISSNSLDEEGTGNTNTFKFMVYAFQDLTYTYNPNVGYIYQFPFSTLSPDGYDPYNTYTLDDDVPQQNQNGDFINYFRCSKLGTYGFNLRFSYQTSGSLPQYFRISVRKSTDPNDIISGTQVYVTPGSGYLALPTQDSDSVFFDVDLVAGEYLAAFIVLETGAGNPYQTLTIGGYDDGVQVLPNARFELYEAPDAITDTIIANNLPDIKAKDFLKAILKMFNGTFISQGNGRILIEPYSWYFGGERDVKDWTQKIDISQSIRISPFSFELPKSHKFTYLSAGDEIHGKYYESTFNERFGQYIYNSNSNILKDEVETELPFRSVPTVAMEGTENIILPEFYKVGDDGRKLPYSDKPHIFFWVGNRFFRPDKEQTVDGLWYSIDESGTTQSHTTYPCVSHLSRLGDFNTSQISDLNFSNHWDFFANVNDEIQQFSQNNLFNVFYKDYFIERYSTTSRKLEGKILLSPSELSDIDLTDRIYIKDSYFRIERIDDANLIETDLCDVTLVKEVSEYVKVEPPAPIYDIEPDTPYPTPEPTPPPTCYSEEVYIGLIQEEVCDNTARVDTIYSYDSSLVAGSRVFTDSGCTTPVQVARFISPTSVGIPLYTFVVNDLDGTIGTSSCK